jgi:protein involved in polysaccharide export with SLBB domain
MTVTKAIAAAGDFDDFANRKNVQLIRANGKRSTVNCIKALADPTLDPKVYPNDKIVVQKTIW